MSNLNQVAHFSFCRNGKYGKTCVPFILGNSINLKKININIIIY